MSITSLSHSDRGVSPVLGVVLLVGITVLLSAAIAGVVLGLGAGPELPPQVDWSFAYDGEGNLTVRHDGGEAIDAAAVEVVGDPVVDPGPLSARFNGTVRAGDEAVIDVDPDAGDDPTVVLVWDGSDGTGHVLAEFSLPPS
ncbi:MAG: type IV pilin [Halobacteriales archaeon]